MALEDKIPRTRAEAAVTNADFRKLSDKMAEIVKNSIKNTAKIPAKVAEDTARAAAKDVVNKFLIDERNLNMAKNYVKSLTSSNQNKAGKQTSQKLYQSPLTNMLPSTVILDESSIDALAKAVRPLSSNPIQGVATEATQRKVVDGVIDVADSVKDLADLQIQPVVIPPVEIIKAVDTLREQSDVRLDSVIDQLKEVKAGTDQLPHMAELDKIRTDSQIDMTKLQLETVDAIDRNQKATMREHTRNFQLQSDMAASLAHISELTDRMRTFSATQDRTQKDWFNYEKEKDRRMAAASVGTAVDMSDMSGGLFKRWYDIHIRESLAEDLAQFTASAFKQAFNAMNTTLGWFAALGSFAGTRAGLMLSRTGAVPTIIGTGISLLTSAIAFGGALFAASAMISNLLNDAETATGYISAFAGLFTDQLLPALKWLFDTVTNGTQIILRDFAQWWTSDGSSAYQIIGDLLNNVLIRLLSKEIPAILNLIGGAFEVVNMMIYELYTTITGIFGIGPNAEMGLLGNMIYLFKKMFSVISFSNEQIGQFIEEFELKEKLVSLVTGLFNAILSSVTATFWAVQGMHKDIADTIVTGVSTTIKWIGSSITAVWDNLMKSITDFVEKYDIVNGVKTRLKEMMDFFVGILPTTDDLIGWFKSIVQSMPVVGPAAIVSEWFGKKVGLLESDEIARRKAATDGKAGVAGSGGGVIINNFNTDARQQNQTAVGGGNRQTRNPGSTAPMTPVDRRLYSVPDLYTR